MIRIFCLIFLYFLIFPMQVFALNNTIGNLEITHDQPIFSPETVWRPGMIVEKNIIMKNIGPNTETGVITAVNSYDPENNADSYMITVSNKDSVVYGENHSRSLKDFMAAGEIVLGTINPGQSVNFKIEVEMLPDADSRRQGKTFGFDLKMGFGGNDGDTNPESNDSKATDNNDGSPQASNAGGNVGQVLGAQSGNTTGNWDLGQWGWSLWSIIFMIWNLIQKMLLEGIF